MIDSLDGCPTVGMLVLVTARISHSEELKLVSVRNAVVYVPTFFTSQPQPQVAPLASSEDLPDLARPSRDAAQVAQSQV
jgi:hypothetical protein